MLDLGKSYKRISHMTRMITFLIILTTLGCVYVPYPIEDLDSGRGVIEDESFNSLTIDTTTIEHVLLKFGEPALKDDNGKTFIYDWVIKDGGGVEILSDTSWTKKSYHEIILKFNDAGVLENKRHRSHTLHENFSRYHLDIPDGKSALIIYRSATKFGENSAPSFPVLVDNRHLFRLKASNFGLLIVDPGVHTIELPSSTTGAQNNNEGVKTRIETSISTETSHIAYFKVYTLGGIFSADQPSLVKGELVTEEEAMYKLPYSFKQIKGYKID